MQSFHIHVRAYATHASVRIGFKHVTADGQVVRMNDGLMGLIEGMVQTLRANVSCGWCLSAGYGDGEGGRDGGG